MGSLNRRRSFIRRSGFRDARLIVLACEGKITEPVYFEAIRRNLLPSPSRVHLEILAREDTASAPESIMADLDSFKRRYNLRGDDELWMVFDFDRWGEAKLANIAAKALSKNILLAVSRPCFEFWLLLHHRDPQSFSVEEVTRISQGKCFTVIDLLRISVGSYSKNLMNANDYMPLVDLARKRAEEMDVDKSARWPVSCGTRVYKVMESIFRK